MSRELPEMLAPGEFPQLEARFLLKDTQKRPLWPARFRELLAREGERRGLPGELFRSKDGRTTPPVHVIGARGWVGLVGTGSDGIGLVESVLPGVLKILQEARGTPVAVQLMEHEKSILPSNRVHTYWIREMVFRKRSVRHPPREEDLPRLIKESVLSGLYRSAGWLWRPDRPDEARVHPDADAFMDVPNLELDVLDILRPRGLQIVTSDGGPCGEYATLCDVQIGLNANLQGVWQVGALTARGYGRIVRQIPRLSLHQEKGVIE